MKKVVLDLDGQRREGTVASFKGTLWVHLDGETFTVDQAKRGGRRAGRGGGATNPGEVAAPMPGKIVKIVAKAGEAVSEQQVLLVMEAMKMEYTLKAQQAGKITDVRVAPGDQVALGQILIKLEPV